MLTYRYQKTTECLGQRKCEKDVLLVLLVPFSRLALSFLLLLPLCSKYYLNTYIYEKLSACLTQAHSKNCLFSMGLPILNLVDCFRGIQNQVGTEFTLGPDSTFSWLHFNLLTFQRDAWKAPAATTGHKDSTARLMASWGTQNTLKIQPRKKQHVVPQGELCLLLPKGECQGLQI